MSWIALAKYAAFAVLTAIVLFCVFLILRNIRLIINPPPPPPVERLGPYTVKDVTTGGSIVVKAGWRGRREQTWKPMYLEAPATGQPCFEESRDNLRALAGSSIVVEMDQGRLLDRDRNNVVGDTIYGESGQDLAIAQLRAGLGQCEKDAPAILKAAQAEAQKAKRGIWATTGSTIQAEQFQKHHIECSECNGVDKNGYLNPLCEEGFRLFKLACEAERDAFDKFQPADAPAPEKERPILRAIIIIFWCVVLIAAVIGGVVGYFYWRSKQ